MTPRAAPMAPAERREALVAATLPLLRKHGRKVSTRQIAQAAGVAEGTIFRAFATKEALVEAALDEALKPGRMQEAVDAIDETLPLRERLLAVVTVFQDRFTETFDLMMKVGMIGPPRPSDEELRERWRQRLVERLVEIFGADAERLTVAPTMLAHLVRLLTFAGTHPSISDGRRLTPEEVVDVLLYGVLRRPDPSPEEGSS